MKFTISQDSIKEFKNCIKTTASIYDMTDRSSKVFIKVENNILYTVISLNDNFIKFKSTIEDLSLIDGESKFLTFDLKTFSSLLDKASQVEDKPVYFESKSSKISLKNGKSVYSFQAFNNYDDEEFEDEFNLRNNKFSETFKDSTEITINQELIDFIDLSSKAIKLIKVLNKSYLVNGIMIDGDNLKFCDQEFFLIEKKMSMNYGKGERYLPYNLFSIFTSLFSLIGEFKVKLTNNTNDEGNFISIMTDDDYSFDMIFSVPFVTCVFPTADELAAITPEDNLKYEFMINRNELLNSLKLFEGVFPSATWAFKQVKLLMDKSDNELRLEFDDMNTEVKTSVKISDKNIIINPNKKEDETDEQFKKRLEGYEFLKCGVSTFSLSGFLEKECQCETLKVIVNPESPTFDLHGNSVYIESPEDGIKISLAKMLLKS